MNDEQLEQLPPTATLVYYILEDADRPLTKDEIADRTHRPKRSVTKALGDLRDADLVISRYTYNDARRKEFSSKSGGSGEDSLFKSDSS